MFQSGAVLLVTQCVSDLEPRIEFIDLVYIVLGH